MRFLTYIFALILAFLVMLQNIGGRYGSYVVFSWMWLLITLSPLFAAWMLKHPKQISSKHLVYFIFLISLILIQPSIKEHPILILGGSLVLVIPFIVFEFLQVKRNLEIQIDKLDVDKLDEEIINQCKELIGKDSIEKCFEILLVELKNEKLKQTILLLKQKWNQNSKEKSLNLNTNEWIDIQSSKIINELLNVLNMKTPSNK